MTEELVTIFQKFCIIARSLNPSCDHSSRTQGSAFNTFRGRGNGNNSIHRFGTYRLPSCKSWFNFKRTHGFILCHTSLNHITVTIFFFCYVITRILVGSQFKLDVQIITGDYWITAFQGENLLRWIFAGSNKHNWFSRRKVT